LIVLAFPTVANAQCPEVETCCLALGAVERASNWKSLHEVVSLSTGCDDVWLAEAYSEKISILLAERWQLLSQLDRISKSEPKFLLFVLEHIDRTIAADRWERIRDSATNRCPNKQAVLCDRIRQAGAR